MGKKAESENPEPTSETEGETEEGLVLQWQEQLSETLTAIQKRLEAIEKGLTPPANPPKASDNPSSLETAIAELKTQLAEVLQLVKPQPPTTPASRPLFVRARRQ